MIDPKTTSGMTIIIGGLIVVLVAFSLLFAVIFGTSIGVSAAIVGIGAAIGMAAVLGFSLRKPKDDA